jgi:hypothetical protein
MSTGSGGWVCSPPFLVLNSTLLSSASCASAPAESAAATSAAAAHRTYNCASEWQLQLQLTGGDLSQRCQHMVLVPPRARTWKCCAFLGERVDGLPRGARRARPR